MSPLASKTLEIAGTQDGKCEVPHGSNWGPDVQKYLASVGINFPAAWCMSFVYWCVSQAAASLGVKNPLVKTGGVIYQYDHIDTSHKVHEPQIGDIFIMEFVHGTGHTGFVTGFKNGLVHTIEGNTNDDGSREGYEVARRYRPINSFKGFIRL